MPEDHLASPGGNTPPRFHSFLARIPRSERDLLRDQWRCVRFEPDEAIYSAAAPLTACTFIEVGVVSQLLADPSGKRVEVGMLGPGGMVGLDSVFGHGAATMDTVAINHCEGVQISAAALSELMARSDAMRITLGRYLFARLRDAMHISVCNSNHRLLERVARWIAMIDARIDTGDVIHLTHRGLARQFGVRRASVTEALQILEGEGAIRAKRGLIEMRDRARLSEISCGCEALVDSDSVLQGLRDYPDPIVMPARIAPAAASGD